MQVHAQSPQTTMFKPMVPLVCGCVKHGLPTPPSTSGPDPSYNAPTTSTSSLYDSTVREWDARVRHARSIVRKKGKQARAPTNHTLEATEGEALVSSEEVRALYGGVMLVGDSQVRELAWAVLKALSPQFELRFGDDRGQLFTEGRTEAAQQRSRRRLRSPCLPQTVGKLGFTAVCTRGAQSIAHTYAISDQIPTGA